MNSAYWLLQIIYGDPVLRGPYASDAVREHELDMCLIDPGTEHIVLIDPGNPPHAWKPSHQYKQERLDRLAHLEDTPDE